MRKTVNREQATVERNKVGLEFSLKLDNNNYMNVSGHSSTYFSARLTESVKIASEVIPSTFYSVLKEYLSGGLVLV